MPTLHKAQIAARVKRRGTTSDRGAGPVAPDAMLVALGTRFEELSAELAALQKGKVAPFSAPAAPGEQLKDVALIKPSAERIEAILALLDPIERAIMATPAATVVGLGVKARHAAHVLSHYWIDSTDTLDWDVRAVPLLIESTCTVAGVGLISSPQ